jgi:hypothetical protein
LLKCLINLHNGCIIDNEVGSLDVHDFTSLYTFVLNYCDRVHLFSDFYSSGVVPYFLDMGVGFEALRGFLISLLHG